MIGTRQAFVGVGANLGDRQATTDAAIARLRATSGVTSVVTSRCFETEPIGVLEQPVFLNLVAGLETCLSPEELLRVLQEIETGCGRVRIDRWGPRTLDLDLLAFAGETRSAAALQLPHPRMLERNFVVVPLRELVGRSPFRENPDWDRLRAELKASRAQGEIRPFPKK